jgi:hypothetical protein
MIRLVLEQMSRNGLSAMAITQPLLKLCELEALVYVPLAVLQ